MKIRVCYAIDNNIARVISITNVDSQRENLSWYPHVADAVAMVDGGQFEIEKNRNNDDVYLADLIEAYYDFMTKLRMEIGG